VQPVNEKRRALLKLHTDRQTVCYRWMGWVRQVGHNTSKTV